MRRIQICALPKASVVILEHSCGDYLCLKVLNPFCFGISAARQRVAAPRRGAAQRQARAPLQEMRGAQGPDLLKSFVRIIIRTIVGFYTFGPVSTIMRIITEF